MPGGIRTRQGKAPCHGARHIRDNANGNAWSVGAVSFDDVPVGAAGTFGSGGSGDIIWGGFHGLNHAEAEGTFEKHGIVDGFGARRESRRTCAA